MNHRQIFTERCYCLLTLEINALLVFYLIHIYHLYSYFSHTSKTKIIVT